jgi:signal transduction histidine kinase
MKLQMDTDADNKNAAISVQAELLQKTQADQAVAKKEVLRAQYREFVSYRTACQLRTSTHNTIVYASKAKSDFISFICHELRNPLQGVVCVADVLHNYARDENLDEGIVDCIKTLKVQTETMHSIINDVLDMGKIESGKLDMNYIDFDLHGLLRDIVVHEKLKSKIQQGDATDDGVAMELILGDEVPQRGLGDPLRLRQILTNLVGNASKFTRRGYVRVMAELLSTVGQLNLPSTSICGPNIRISIIDTGIGISAANKAHLFKPFQQADAAISQKFGGTGMGLYISKNLLTIMGGDITICSEEEVGSTVAISFAFPPINTASLDSTDDVPRLNSKRKSISNDTDEGILCGLRILMADDDKITLKMWSRRLTRAGSTVVTMCNGRDVIEELRHTQDYEVLLCDGSMPFKTGVEVAVAVRNELKLTLPIIACTGHVLAADRDTFIRAGMSGVLHKPFGMPELVRMLHVVLPVQVPVYLAVARTNELPLRVGDGESNGIGPDSVVAQLGSNGIAPNEIAPDSVVAQPGSNGIGQVLLESLAIKLGAHV